MSIPNQHKYKLLAFATLVKLHQTNSVLYGQDGGKATAKALGISYNAFKKYRKQSLELGLLVPKGKHHQFLGIRSIFKMLDLEEMGKHHRFFRYVSYGKASLKVIYNQIVKALVLNNYKQQDHRIKQKSFHIEVFEAKERNRTLDDKFLRVWKKLEKKGETLPSLRSSLQKTIVSGKNHVAGIIGMSPSTGARLLRKYHKAGIIERSIITKRINLEYNHGSYDFIKEFYNKCIVIPIPSLGIFLHSLGSAISLPDPQSSSRYQM
jgi:hypothetical protein